MATILSLLIQLAGLACLIRGYRQSRRSMLLVAALLLWSGAGLDEFVHGFADGWRDGAVARS